MGDSVTVSQAVSSDYSWDTASFAWDSDDGHKSWAQASAFSYTLNANETLAVAESVAKRVAIALMDSWTLAEKRNFSVALGVVEQLRMSETFTDVANFTIRFTESLTLSEALGNALDRTFNEQFGMSDAVSKNPSLGIQESIAIAETFAKRMTLAVSEALQVLEENGLVLTKSLAEEFAVGELHSFNVRKEVAEAIALLEVFGRTTVFKRNYAETLSVQESLAKAVTLSKSEVFQVLEEYRRHANAVISDISILHTELDMFSFANIVDSGHAPGFADFKDFIPGDYNYDKAIFRVILESSNTDRARLRTLSVSVDVPDVTDRGTATVQIAATGVRVNFSRTFHVPPEVVLTLHGGSVIAIPTLLGGVDTSGFTAVLVNPADGSRVTGTFTWAAQGY